jgi:hypothetical protein
MNTTTTTNAAEQVVADFIAAHAAYPQYADWFDGHTWEVRRVTRTIGGMGTFVRAEIGDLVIVRYANARGFLTSIPNYDSIYCPRVGWVVAGSGDFHTEPLEA